MFILLRFLLLFYVFLVHYRCFIVDSLPNYIRFTSSSSSTVIKRSFNLNPLLLGNYIKGITPAYVELSGITRGEISPLWSRSIYSYLQGLNRWIRVFTPITQGILQRAIKIKKITYEYTGDIVYCTLVILNPFLLVLLYNIVRFKTYTIVYIVPLVRLFILSLLFTLVSMWGQILITLLLGNIIINSLVLFYIITALKGILLLFCIIFTASVLMHVYDNANVSTEPTFTDLRLGCLLSNYALFLTISIKNSHILILTFVIISIVTLLIKRNIETARLL